MKIQIRDIHDGNLLSSGQVFSGANALEVVEAMQGPPGPFREPLREYLTMVVNNLRRLAGIEVLVGRWGCDIPDQKVASDFLSALLRDGVAIQVPDEEPAASLPPRAADVGACGAQDVQVGQGPGLADEAAQAGVESAPVEVPAGVYTAIGKVWASGIIDLHNWPLVLEAVEDMGFAKEARWIERNRPAFMAGLKHGFARARRANGS